MLYANYMVYQHNQNLIENKQIPKASFFLIGMVFVLSMFCENGRGKTGVLSLV